MLCLTKCEIEYPSSTCSMEDLMSTRLCPPCQLVTSMSVILRVNQSHEFVSISMSRSVVRNLPVSHSSVAREMRMSSAVSMSRFVVCTSICMWFLLESPSRTCMCVSLPSSLLASEQLSTDLVYLYHEPFVAD